MWWKITSRDSPLLVEPGFQDAVLFAFLALRKCATSQFLCGCASSVVSEGFACKCSNLL